MGITKLPRGSSTGSVVTQSKMGFADGGAPGHTPIMAASGEYVIHPDIVLRIGKGDLQRGDDVLDRLMVQLRNKHVRQLRNLPGPVKR